MDSNPYQAPLENWPQDTPDTTRLIERDDAQLIVESGVVLPPYCVKTGEPISAAGMKTKKLTWCPIWVVIVFVVSPLIGVIVYFFVRKTCEVTYGLSPEIKRKYLTRQLIAFFVALLSIGGLVWGGSINHGGVLLGSLVLLLISLVMLLVGNSPISAANHVNGKFWIKGCSPLFLDRIEN